MRFNLERARLLAIGVGFVALFAVACGDDAGSTATPTATLTPANPTATATSAPAVREPTPTASSALPGPSGQTSTDGREADVSALEAVVDVQAEAFNALIDAEIGNSGDADVDAYYETCHPDIRQLAKDSKAVEAQLRNRPDGISDIRFEVEQIIFSGETSATVIFGAHYLDFNLPAHTPGWGGGLYEKVDGRWYGLGWGCA